MADPPAPSALLAGATGLVGSLCLDLLLDDPSFGGVVALARRPLPRSHTRLTTLTVDFARLDDVPPAGTAPSALCALGTTIERAGSDAAFRAVDHDAVLAFARWARRSGADTCVLCSSVGAAPRSRTFYLRVKGETEAAVATVGFRRLVILRPSLLLGPRAERRIGEGLAQSVMPALNPLLAGPLRRYRAIRAKDVAAAMVEAAKMGGEGQEIWEYDMIRRGAARGPPGQLIA